MQANGIYKTEIPQNEPVIGYERNSEKREQIKRTISQLQKQDVEIPMFINGKWVSTDSHNSIHPPHEISNNLGFFHEADTQHVQTAIESALKAKNEWTAMSWHARAAIFLKAADLISGPYRNLINAATMIGQSKTVHQAEIDAACELCDFLRYNVYFMTQLYDIQPGSVKNIWNQTDWRPLEGFVLAITPFNFTAIAGNLPTAPAITGNTVVWKPALSQVLSAHVIMEVLEKAGLPAGVINMVLGTGEMVADVAVEHPELAGIHFTGSTEVFEGLWQKTGSNIGKYNSFPRLIGETGGKDFIIAHSSADMDVLITAIIRGAFEFQGQKCSAASRAYIAKSLWDQMKESLIEQVHSIRMGSPEEFSNFMCAVIDQKAYSKLSKVLDFIHASEEAEIIAGGGYSDEVGYFIEPTVVVTSNPHFFSMEEELFGPIITIYVFEDNQFSETLELLNKTSKYGLTGAIFANDRRVIELASEKLRFAAGNFYINDKPTGSIVGQQPFGGGRKSGTNDKAGSLINIMRWTSPRSIKENFVPPTDYGYPFMKM
ncbi:MAG: L-glutamate gamma-semialdehyde dehydrogenase [Bacteroidetes bacterium]|jgi:1-pyrroline-5-carboxylate dehydrogenase|nr:L-glutamate gamma-semialdehyde dehydrogenase [Bacteroidota bacterium]